jgi:hypothetical protein
MDSWLIGNFNFSIAFKHEKWQPNFFGHQQLSTHLKFGCHSTIVVTYEIRVFFEGAQKEVFSSIFKKTL